MSMMVSFVLSFFPQDVLDEILNLIESVSEGGPSYSCLCNFFRSFQWSYGFYLFVIPCVSVKSRKPLELGT